MDNDRDLLLISIFTFMTVSLWIVFELIKTVKTTTVSATTQQIIVPLNPEFDIDTLTNITNKREY